MRLLIRLEHTKLKVGNMLVMLAVRRCHADRVSRTQYYAKARRVRHS